MKKPNSLIISTVSLIISFNTVHFSDSSVSFPRFKRQNCEFQCNNGNCIEEGQLCDGIKDCADFSDEEEEFCDKMFCVAPSFPEKGGWKLVGNSSGSLSPGDRVKRFTTLEVFCENGYRLRNPEESTTFCVEGKWTLDDFQCVSNDFCVAPTYPTNGYYTVMGSFRGPPRKLLPTNTILKYHCKPNHLPNGKHTVYSTCTNGKWSEQQIKCVSICKELKPTGTTDVTCSFENKEIPCRESVQNSEARFKCKQYYEKISSSVPLRCRDGVWDQPVPKCTPICGQISANSTETPWVTGLYLKDKGSHVYKCGGTLVSTRMILTAAHCVTKYNTSELLDPKGYMVAVGKSYSNYNDSRDTYAQYSEVEKFLIPPNHKNLKNPNITKADIAIILTVKSFQLSSKIQPVCLDRANIYEAYEALVAGWGYAPPNQIKEEISKRQDVKVHRSYSGCMNKRPAGAGDREFEYYDNVCATYNSGRVEVCEGTGGTGLVAPFADGKIYIKGILTTFPTRNKNDVCTKEMYSYYILVSKYMPFIVRHLLVSDGNSCGTDQFMCSSGQCVDAETICDASFDCPDYSDEIAEVCSTIRCPQLHHKCANGACVREYVQCEGLKECVDNPGKENCAKVVEIREKSTEENVSTTPGCKAPLFPDNGTWSLPINLVLEPGDIAPIGTTLLYHCKENHLPNGKTKLFSICLENGWTEENVQCLLVCEELESTTTTQISCYHKNREVPCNEAIENTEARFTCKRYHEHSSSSLSRISYCFDGTWDGTKPDCVPVCGQKNVNAVPLVVNGTAAVMGTYPWHTALYIKKRNHYEYQCGGSLISRKLILTAAHCVTNLTIGTLYDAKNYAVAVGKYYRPYNDERDTHAQYSDIQKIWVPPLYRGDSQHFQADIALILTTQVFELSDNVQPVCMDKGDSFHLTPSMSGVIIGWGYTGEKLAEVLQELEVPYRDEEDCWKNLPSHFAYKYYVHDKLCSGYKNQSKAICRGDSGGGLVFPHGNGRYYIKGIVSGAPQKGGNMCDVEEYALYTKVDEYLPFIYKCIKPFDKI